jgi:hypothetical protein
MHFTRLLGVFLYLESFPSFSLNILVNVDFGHHFLIAQGLV